ncbi:hypothetical protein [Glaciibacter sp. 2TAF33]|uniref:hypothetical protein n=1 Tax=Glaciibacter sp. 2TAF33 TaxID=3233015 RepID=UPI003F922DC9
MGHFLTPSSRESLARLTALDDEPAGDPLNVVRGIRSAIADLDADPATLRAVRRAVADGATWDDVAAAAGLKAAAAKWRWQGSDEEIAARHEAGRKRAARPSSVPTDLPGYSVADAARTLGVTPQAIYLRVRRGTMRSQTVQRDDGRSYQRVFLDEGSA